MAAAHPCAFPYSGWILELLKTHLPCAFLCFFVSVPPPQASHTSLGTDLTSPSAHTTASQPAHQHTRVRHPLIDHCCCFCFCCHDGTTQSAALPARCICMIMTAACSTHPRAHTHKTSSACSIIPAGSPHVQRQPPLSCAPLSPSHLSSLTQTPQTHLPLIPCMYVCMCVCSAPAAPCVQQGNGTCCAGETGEACCNVESFMSSKPAVIAVKGGLVGGPDQTDK